MKHTVPNVKVIGTIAWGVSSFHLFNGLTNGQKFNGADDISQLLTALFGADLHPPDLKLIIHSGNCRLYIPKRFRIHLPHWDRPKRSRFKDPARIARCHPRDALCDGSRNCNFDC